MSKLDDWFGGGRRWRLAVEADGDQVARVEGPDGPAEALVRFRKGHFEVDPPFAFASPLGSRGRTGVLLQEVDASGADIQDSLAAWGEATFSKARRVYHAIV